MFYNFLVFIKSLSPTAKKILKYGLIFCSVVCLFSIILLSFYNLSVHDPFLYHLGLSVFKLSLTLAIEFIICGYSVDFIKNDFT